MKSSPAELRHAFRVLRANGCLASAVLDSTCQSCGHPELLLPLTVHGQFIERDKPRVVYCGKCGDAYVHDPPGDKK